MLYCASPTHPPTHPLLSPLPLPLPVQAPPEDSKPLLLQFAQFEEQHGLARNAMQVRGSQ